MKKLLISMFILMLAGSQFCYADNLLTLADFRRASQDQSVLKTHPFYPDSVWNSWINEACCDLSSYGIIEKLDTIEWVAGTTIYSLNNDFIRLIALNPLRPIGKRPLNFIPARDILKREEIGATQGPQDFWQAGKGKNAIVGFFPPPVVKDTLFIIYGAEAGYMDSDNDTTEIPYCYRPLIIDYVVYRALLRDGKKSVSDCYYDSYMRRLEIKLKFEGKQYDVFISPREIKVR